MGSTLSCSKDAGNTIPVQPAPSPHSPTLSDEGNPRNKIALKPGHSLMDWVRLGHSGVDLAGTKGAVLDITPQELAKHNTRKDAWIALKGKVYNVTPYMEYHPGGEDELMRGAGQDATQLFNEVHKWVNFEGMLQKCLVGRLTESRSFFLKPSFLPLGRSSTSVKTSGGVEQKKSLLAPSSGTTLSGATSPLVSPPTPSPLPAPKYDWFQTHSTINIAIYTRWKHIAKEHVVVLKRGAVVKVVCYIQDMVYVVNLELDKPVADEFEVQAGGSSVGKVDVRLQKSEEGVRWSRVGKTLMHHGKHIRAKDLEIEYVECTLARRETITYNTCLLVLQVPENINLPVPVGHHVYLRSPNKEVVKPYTPVAPKLSLANQESGRHIHLFIKVYSDGALTPILDSLPVSSSVEVSLPEGSFTHDQLMTATSVASNLVLLAAGTGLTPMVKLMLLALKNKRNVHLIIFNKTERDIPWKEEFESLVKDSSSLLKVTHVLSEGSISWGGERGRINSNLLDKLLPERVDERTTFLCLCGPTEFTKLGVSVLDELGYKSDEYHAFLG